MNWYWQRISTAKNHTI